MLILETDPKYCCKCGRQYDAATENAVCPMSAKFNNYNAFTCHFCLTNILRNNSILINCKSCGVTFDYSIRYSRKDSIVDCPVCKKINTLPKEIFNEIPKSNEAIPTVDNVISSTGEVENQSKMADIQGEPEMTIKSKTIDEGLSINYIEKELKKRNLQINSISLRKGDWQVEIEQVIINDDLLFGDRLGKWTAICTNLQGALTRAIAACDAAHGGNE